jgi:hypothetical protein
MRGYFGSSSIKTVVLGATLALWVSASPAGAPDGVNLTGDWVISIGNGNATATMHLRHDTSTGKVTFTSELSTGSGRVSGNRLTMVWRRRDGSHHGKDELRITSPNRMEGRISNESGYSAKETLTRVGRRP